MAVLAGEIELDQVRFHPDRNKLIKAIGKENVSAPEYGECFIDSNHSHAFMLCSDGFWEYVTEEEMEQTLRECSEPSEWIQKMVQILRNKVSTQMIANDNYSVVVFFV